MAILWHSCRRASAPNLSRCPGRFAPESMDDLGRNHWTNWTGIGGLFAPESVDGFNRNGWTICPGIGGRFGPEYARNESLKDVHDILKRKYHQRLSLLSYTTAGAVILSLLMVSVK